MTHQDVAVLLEEIRSQFRVFGEALQGNREVLGEKIDRLDTRLSHVELHVSVLRTDVGILKTDVGSLKSDVAVLKDDVSDVKIRLERVEHHLGLNGASPKASRKPRR